MTAAAETVTLPVLSVRDPWATRSTHRRALRALISHQEGQQRATRYAATTRDLAPCAVPKLTRAAGYLLDMGTGSVHQLHQMTEWDHLKTQATMTGPPVPHAERERELATREQVNVAYASIGHVLVHLDALPDTSI